MARIPTSDLPTISSGQAAKIDKVDRSSIKAFAKLSEGAMDMVDALNQRAEEAELANASADYNARLATINEKQKQAQSNGDVFAFEDLAMEKDDLDSEYEERFKSAGKAGRQFHARNVTKNSAVNAGGLIKTKARNVDLTETMALNKSFDNYRVQAAAGQMQPSDIKSMKAMVDTIQDPAKKQKYSFQFQDQTIKAVNNYVANNGENATTKSLAMEANKHLSGARRNSFKESLQVSIDSYAQKTLKDAQKAESASKDYAHMQNGEVMYADAVAKVEGATPNKYLTADLKNTTVQNITTNYHSSKMMDTVNITSQIFTASFDGESLQNSISEYVEGAALSKSVDKQKLKQSLYAKALSDRATGNVAYIQANSSPQLKQAEKSGMGNFMNLVAESSKAKGIDAGKVSYTTKSYVSAVKNRYSELEGSATPLEKRDFFAGYYNLPSEHRDYAMAELIKTQALPQEAYASMFVSDVSMLNKSMYSDDQFKINFKAAGFEKHEDVLADVRSELDINPPPMNHPSRQMYDSMVALAAKYGVTDGQNNISDAVDQVKSQFTIFEGQNGSTFIGPINASDGIKENYTELSFNSPTNTLEVMNKINGYQIDIPEILSRVNFRGAIDRAKADLVISQFKKGNYTEALDGFNDLLPISMQNGPNNSVAFFTQGQPISVSNIDSFSLSEISNTGYYLSSDRAHREAVDRGRK